MDTPLPHSGGGEPWMVSWSKPRRGGAMTHAEGCRGVPRSVRGGVCTHSCTKAVRSAHTHNGVALWHSRHTGSVTPDGLYTDDGM